MALPTAWVDRIFDKCTLTYGQAFLRRWQDVDINAVKSDWAHELSGLSESPSCIAYALQRLPEDPPTVLQFRRLARSMPEAASLPVEYSKAGQDRINAELEKLNPKIRGELRDDGKEWARRIIANSEQGIHSKSSLPLKMARAALAERSIFQPRARA